MSKRSRNGETDQARDRLRDSEREREHLEREREIERERDRERELDKAGATGGQHLRHRTKCCH